MSRTRLALCMIVKDEADNLADCLKSVQGLVDEMIVVDTGSSDDTMAIAKEFGASVYTIEWQNDFARARNVACDHAGGDWILVLDADEVLNVVDHDRIRALIANDDADAYSLLQRTYQGQSTLAGWQALTKPDPFARGCPGYLDNPLVRLFRNQPGIRFKGRLHEVVDHDLMAGHKKIVATDIPIHHYEKLLGPKRLKRKQALYRAIGEAKIKQDPRDDRGLSELGVLYLEMGMAAEAEQALNQAVLAAPGNLRAAFNLGVAKARQGRPDEAANLYEKILKQNPDHLGATNNLAQILQESGQYEKALNLYEKGLKNNPNHHVLHYNCGLVLEKIGDTTRAQTHFQKAVDIDPGFEQALKKLKSGPPAETRAPRMTENIVTKNRKERLLAEAALHQEEGRLDEALQLYVDAIEIDPEDADVRFGCGYLLEKLSEREAALQQYQDALAIDPKHVKTLWRLAHEARRQMWFEDAISLCEEIISIDENHLDAHLLLADLIKTDPKIAETEDEPQGAADMAPQHQKASPDSGSVAPKPNPQDKTISDDLGFTPLRIVFVWGGIPFRGDSLAQKPLGGTETALIHMARNLAELGHEVWVYVQDGNGLYERVRYAEITNYMDDLHKAPADVLIAARTVHPFSVPVSAGLRIFWTEDAHDQPFLTHLDNPALVSRMDKIFTVSRWQTETIKSRFNLSDDKFFITRNGVLWDRFRQNGHRPESDVKRLVYTSTPFRGLDVLLALFPRIKARVPDATLDVYSSMAVYQVDAETDQAENGDLYAKAAQPGVSLKGSVLQEDLAEALKNATVMAYPNHFAETSCIAAMEAMAAGLPVVTTRLGALPETVAAGGVLIEGDAHGKAYQDRFVDEVCDLLENRSRRDALGRAASYHIRDHNRWETIAAEWSRAFGAWLDVTTSAAQDQKSGLSQEQMMEAEDLTQTPADPYFGPFLNELRQALSVGGSELGLGLSLFSLAVSIRAATIIEIGRFKGFSTLALAGALKFIDDGWQEPEQHKQRPDMDYDRFEKAHTYRLFSIDPHPTGEALERIQKAGLEAYVEFIDKRSDQIDFSADLDFGADLIFIDGDHSYEGCKRDVNRFVPQILRPGGYFVLHDYYGWFDQNGRNNSPIKKVADELMATGDYEHVLMDTGYQSFVLFRKKAA